MNLNVGGGGFNYHGWLNLDAKTGFALTKDCVFPVDSAEIIYSSHCLEHLDDQTVDRVLSEARRMNCWLVLKLPDFEQVLERRAARDHHYFTHWGLEPIVHMWDEDTIDSRASMIFCGWWNDEYGHEFTGEKHPYAKDAYHGPAGKIPEGTPHEIAAALKALVPEGCHFNHQNAWSRAELKALLEKHGFRVSSMNAEKIIEASNIPGIADMKAISMYVLAR